MPLEENRVALLKSIHDYWNPIRNRTVRGFSANRRGFHRDRNYALIMTLLEGAARIGEILSLKDYRPPAG